MFAKKSKSSNLEDVYYSNVKSYTHGNENKIVLSKEICNSEDNILIIDDFMAIGNATEGMIEIVEKAGMNLVGVGIAIEKGFQGGGDKLREKGYDIYSVAIIDKIDNDKIIFRKKEEV